MLFVRRIGYRYLITMARGEVDKESSTEEFEVIASNDNNSDDETCSYDSNDTDEEYDPDYDPESDLEYVGVTYKTIDDDFTYANFGGVTAIMRKNGGYINITSLCGNHKKHTKALNAFLLSSDYNNLMHDVKQFHKNTDTKPCELVLDMTETSGVTGGMYVHPEAIYYMATICCPEYASHVFRIVNAYYVKEEADRGKFFFDGQDRIITLLTESTKTMTEDNRVLENKIRKLGKRNRRQKKKAKSLASDNKYLREYNQELLDSYDENCAYVEKVEREKSLIKITYVTMLLLVLSAIWLSYFMLP